MNLFAYRITGLAVRALSGLSKARINLHGTENIPEGAIIFVINHFTRIETFLIPYHIYKLTNIPVWSLAHHSLFVGPLGVFLEKLGAVSTTNPDRDLLIVKSLLTGDAAWIIFPEGRMVKNKKIIEKGQFMLSYAGVRRPPHTGAATLALRAEFYRQRLEWVSEHFPGEAKRLMDVFQIDQIEPVLQKTTYIVPVNITYYPVRTQENILSNLIASMVGDVPERMIEEIMTEGTMLLSGVDVDIRFGEPIKVDEFIKSRAIIRDICSNRPIYFDDPIPSKRKMRKVAFNIMQRYMSAIYSMTTVNHDHLFASMLKLMPFRKIDERDLKRRVFLATTRKLDKLGAYLHESLTKDQVHLLTDDRFNKFKDFISLAVEKGVVKQDGKTLIKDPSKFTSSFDFHRVRIDNPIKVIANEVEPLPGLQGRVRSLAWQPSFWLRRKIARHLMSKAVSGFEQDYETFYVAGESKKRDVGMPFLVKGKSRKLGVVLVHGYMAAPLEVRELGDYLGRMGLWVYAPRLKGHGTSPDDLATRTYMDWVTSIDEGFAIISNICKRVVVGGFSTGGGLALDLAARVGDVEGVFAVCPPMGLQDFSARFVPAMDVWNRLMEMVNLDEAKKEFIENRPENPHINYFRNPICGIRELERLMKSLEPKLPAINVPALVVQSAGDPVVNPEGTKRVFDMLGSESKKYVLFDFDCHGILVCEGSERVHRTIGSFIKHL